jgi:hypothetical protein
MDQENIRLGQTLHVLTHSDLVTGKVESGHMGQWMLRTSAGELTGPWDTEDLHQVLYVATINIPGYLPMADEPTVFETIKAAWEWLIEERNRSWNEDDDEQGPDYDGTMANMDNMVDCGSVHGSTPGYEGDHDLGLAYSVNVYQGD